VLGRAAAFLVLVGVSWGCSSGAEGSDGTAAPTVVEPASTDTANLPQNQTAPELPATTSATEIPGSRAQFDFVTDGIPFHLDILHSVGADFAGDVMWVTLDGYQAVVSHQVRALGDPADEGCPYALWTFPLAPGTHVIEVETGRTDPLVATFELATESRGVIQYRDPSYVTWQDLGMPVLAWEIMPGPAVFRMNQNNGIDLCPRWELVADTEPSDTAATSTITATTPPTAPAVTTVEEATRDEEISVMLGVVTGGPGLVAVGWVGAEGDDDAAVWTSPDGVIWSRVPRDEAVFGGEGPQSMGAVAAGRAGFVAVGGEGVFGDSDAAVWASSDGFTWSRVVAQDRAVFGGEYDQWMNAVAASGPGFVAVGYDGPSLFEVDGPEPDWDAAVWRSCDGVDWFRVRHDESVFGGDGDQEMNSVSVGGPGLVAVGSDGWNAAVWTSVDGVSWARVPHDEDVFGRVSWISDVTTWGPGLVAVGSDGTDAVVWTSPDGLTWSRVPEDGVFGGPFQQQMWEVAVGGPGLVAVGWDEGRAGGASAVWISDDGVSWSRLAEEVALSGGVGDRGIADVVAGDSGLVAVGGEGTDAAGWLLPVVGGAIPLPPGNPGVAEACVGPDTVFREGDVTVLDAGAKPRVLLRYDFEVGSRSTYETADLTYEEQTFYAEVLGFVETLTSSTASFEVLDAADEGFTLVATLDGCTASARDMVEVLEDATELLCPDQEDRAVTFVVSPTGDLTSVELVGTATDGAVDDLIDPSAIMKWPEEPIGVGARWRVVSDLSISDATGFGIDMSLVEVVEVISIEGSILELRIDAEIELGDEFYTLLEVPREAVVSSGEGISTATIDLTRPQPVREEIEVRFEFAVTADGEYEPGLTFLSIWRSSIRLTVGG
jgi:hypothetical protein